MVKTCKVCHTNVDETSIHLWEECPPIEHLRLWRDIGGESPPEAHYEELILDFYLSVEVKTAMRKTAELLTTLKGGKGSSQQPLQ